MKEACARVCVYVYKCVCVSGGCRGRKSVVKGKDACVYVCARIYIYIYIYIMYMCVCARARIYVCEREREIH